MKKLLLTLTLCASSLAMAEEKLQLETPANSSSLGMRAAESNVQGIAIEKIVVMMTDLFPDFKVDSMTFMYLRNQHTTDIKKNRTFKKMAFVTTTLSGVVPLANGYLCSVVSSVSHPILASSSKKCDVQIYCRNDYALPPMERIYISGMKGSCDQFNKID